MSFHGESLTGRAAIGYVSHQSLIYNDLSGLENLSFFARLYGIPTPDRRALEMLTQMGLHRVRHQLARHYSRGMKQRLSLARALLHEPRLLLLDEPYAGLDQHGSRLLTHLLSGLKSEGRTVLLITHNWAEGLAVATRVAVMNRGQIVHQALRSEIDDDGFESFYFGLLEQ
jgi:heme exporter protein A